MAFLKDLNVKQMRIDHDEKYLTLKCLPPSLPPSIDLHLCKKLDYKSQSTISPSVPPSC